MAFQLGIVSSEEKKEEEIKLLEKMDGVKI